MFIVAALITLLLVILAGVNLLVEQASPEELSNMGIERKS
jgi:hypothetical protein